MSDRSGSRHRPGEETVARTVRFSTSNSWALDNEAAQTGVSVNAIVNALVSNHFASSPLGATTSYVSSYTQNLATVRDEHTEAIARLAGEKESP